MTVTFSKIFEPKEREADQRNNEAFWTRCNCAVLDRTISPGELTADVKVKLVNKEFNSHLNLCICPICANIMNRPILFTMCHHSICYYCLIPEWKV